MKHGKLAVEQARMDGGMKKCNMQCWCAFYLRRQVKTCVRVGQDVLIIPPYIFIAVLIFKAKQVKEEREESHNNF